jgi:nitrite reductase/ring-hydroxylating ferredoxin subunit
MQHVHALEDPSMHADGPTGYMQVFERAAAILGFHGGKGSIICTLHERQWSRLDGPIQELPVDAMLGSLTTTDTKESRMDMP